jgi:diaminohydroxyphosphoribosylaminopyrimidine deaminase/5-amino-6-(5-phosphoribosylamino)uracil reductase
MTDEERAAIDDGHMRTALQAAARALPSPNPPVGAVVTDADGAVIASGFHERAGEPHAEQVALTAAGASAKGGTLYVTLEPCNHVGRTPPCVDQILKSGVRRVVIGCLDPNPNVEGGGAERLRAAGLKVDVGVLGEATTAFLEPWSTFITTGLPHVSIKLALSLDGRIATRTGASRWVTGPEARAKVQELRAQSDAIAVGIGTAIADDPRLTVRDPDFAGRHPRRVIFDSSLRLPADCRLVQTTDAAPVVLITTPEASEDRAAELAALGCEIARVAATAEGRVDMESALRYLAQSGVVSLLIEGGAELAGSALASRLVHRLHAFVAPVLLGPRGRPGAVDWAGPDTPDQAPRIVRPTWELVGDDAYVHGAVQFPGKE